MLDPNFTYRLVVVAEPKGNTNPTARVEYDIPIDLLDHNFADPTQNNAMVREVRDYMQTALETHGEMEPWFKQRTRDRRKERLRKLTMPEIKKLRSTLQNLASLIRRDKARRDLYIKTCEELRSIDYEMDCRANPSLSRRL